MSEAKLCPHCGADLSAAKPLGIEPAAPGEDIHPKTLEQESFDPALSATALLAPGSHDDTFLTGPHAGIGQPTEPDPILREFVGEGNERNLERGGGLRVAS